MAILTTVKNKMTAGLVSATDKSANLVAKASGLSSEQLQDIEERRKIFMNEKPETSPEGIRRLLGSYAIEAFEEYLPRISSLYEPIPIRLEENDENQLMHRIRYFEIAKWVTDPTEDGLEKLVNVYQVINREECNMALIYNRKVDGCKVYLAIVSTSDKDTPSIANALEDRIASALKGNFPGSEIKQRDKEIKEKNEFGIGVLPCFSDISGCSVASVSNIATEKSEDFLNQRMEKLLDGICPQNEKEEYSIVLLATPMMEQLERKNALSDLYSKLAPFAKWQTSFTYSDYMAEGASAAVTASLGTSVGRQSAYEEIEQYRGTEEEKNSEIKRQTREEVNRTLSRIEGDVMACIESAAMLPLVKTRLQAKVQASIRKEREKNRIEQNVSEKSKVALNSFSNLYQTGKRGIDVGANFGASFSRASNVTVTIGKNEGITQNYVNHTVKYTLDTIEKQIKRLEESSSLGMWDFSAYFISKDPVIANNAAHMYLALTQGDDSYLSQSAVNLWTQPVAITPIIKDEERKKAIEEQINKEKKSVNDILEFLKHLQHPQFQLKDVEEDEWLMYPPHVSTTVSLTGRELARALNFPKKSISGIPVMDCASFGREVHKYELNVGSGNTVSIGKVYHMHHDEKANVDLDLNSLAAHTFITGSTGTGKSNAVYQIIAKAREQGKNFLVIEPAKGEYKNWFGGAAHVLGTNPNETDLLYINPFSFPDRIHVLEHIDRFVEILNACWPMYAAMPAVLKDAVERIYVNRGWNLQKSKCAFAGNNIFPTFADLLAALPEVMNESAYSSDTKSDYLGALVTRIKSLTNGLNGQLLCSGIETDEKTLFEEDTIIDLSRIGAMETRSLFMGILIMKLQEFHMSREKQTDEELKHITILEEAHNLLRKTSTDQFQEGANLQGKSVEMITNSIAEMRAYGEGFIIVDQAPGLLDEAVIRNTNTKIILRLPDADDRDMVGRAAALNEMQINEIAKLPKGVAVVYQNNWIESVLCHFSKYENKDEYKKEECQSLLPQEVFCKLVFAEKGFKDLRKDDLESVLNWIANSKYSRETKRLMRTAVEGKSLTTRENQLIAYNVFGGKEIAKLLSGAMTEQEGIEQADYFVSINTGIEDKHTLEFVRQMIIQVIVSQNNESDLAKRYIEYAGRIR